MRDNDKKEGGNDEEKEETSFFNSDLNPGVKSYLTEVGKITADQKESFAIYDRMLSGQFEAIKVVGEKFGKIADSFSSQLKETFKLFDEFIEGIRKTYPIVSEYSSRLKAEGWVMPLHYPLRHINYFQVLYGQDITKKIVSFYVRDNYHYLYETFDNFIDDLPEGYKKEFKKMSALLKEDISNYKLIVPWLYMVLDYRFSMKFIESNQGEQSSFMSGKAVKEMIKTFEKNKNNKWFIEIFHSDALDLIFKEIEYASFADKPRLNRHFVLHGRIHPSEYQFIDFLRLLNLSALSSNFLK